MKIAPDHELLDVKTGHDRLSSPRIIGKEEAQRLAAQHLFVDGRYLVRKGVHERGMDGEERVEQIGEVDAVGLGDQPEKGPVRVETPRPALGNDFQPRFVVPVNELISWPAGGVLERQLDDVVAEPLGAQNGNQSIRQDSPDRRTRLEIFQTCHRFRSAETPSSTNRTFEF